MQVHDIGGPFVFDNLKLPEIFMLLDCHLINSVPVLRIFNGRNNCEGTAFEMHVHWHLPHLDA